LNRHDLSVEGF